MRLHTREWGAGPPVVCVHGLCQHGGVFAGLAETLAAAGRRVVAVDLRGHGGSGAEPPWSVAAHVADLLETTAAAGIEKAAWVGHSFGGHVLAALAAAEPGRVERLALLDPGFALPPEYALARAERDRLDWTFAGVEGATMALLSAEGNGAPEEVVRAFVASDLRPAADGRLRFSYSPPAVVVAWSEMVLEPPPPAPLPTLLVRPVAAASDHSRAQDLRYRKALGPLLTMAAVPKGHHVLWESPQETAAAVSSFLAG
ncbi:MAG TPA: alpha/beta hydrolase [Solirubrobacterales bacterium]|nr:alpha/beta hydrolase [Solirubrobacterales bacterium]